MKNDFFKFSSKRILFSTVMASALLAGSPQTVFADAKEVQTVMQNGTVEGMVVDATGEPVIGASVQVKGTGTGVISDINGNFTVNASSDATLIISYIGYKTQEVALKGKRSVKVILQEDAEMLDEVVVVGYGTQKKVNLTSAVSTVGDKEIQDKGVATNPLQSLQGEIPGLAITRESGATGREKWNMQIRGEASVNGTSALVIVDGIPSGIENVNPGDIESISILKDAAAAIYGARAAGGVVLITTKRGKEGKTKVTYRGNVSVNTPITQYNYMNQQQWAYTFEEAVLNDGESFYEGGAFKVFNYDMIQEKKKGRNSQYYNSVIDYPLGADDMGFFDIDYNDYLWKNAVSTSHEISVMGGTEKNRYNLSVGYVKDGSMLKTYDESLKKYSVRLNNDFKFNKYVDLSTNMSFMRSANDFATSNATQYTGLPAGSPLMTPAGNPYGWGGNISGWALTKFGGNTTEKVNSFAVTFQPTFHLMDGLNLVTQASFVIGDTRKQINQKSFTPYRYNDTPYDVISNSPDKVEKTAKNGLYQNYQAYLEYKKTFAKAHAVGVMGGTSYEKDYVERMVGTATGLSTTDIFSLNTGSTKNVTDENDAWALASYFGRLNYGYKDRYLVEFLARYDGSSKFAKGHRWADFYGVFGAWRITEESWMKNQKVFNNLKLRVSYGETGNQSGIDNYDYYSSMKQESANNIYHNYPLFGSTVGQTLKYSNVVSLERTWEVIKTTNFGIDFAVLDNRLSGSFDYYQKKNDGMLASVTYPSILGANAPATNSGTMEVKGWDLQLTWRDRIGSFNYWISGNLSDAKNKITELPNASNPTYGDITKNLEGYSRYTIWGHRFVKLIETEEELNAYKDKQNLTAANKLQIGDAMYANIDGDDKVTKSDIELLGDLNPRYNYGISAGFDYKGFDFRIAFQGVGKRSLWRGTSSGTTGIYAWYEVPTAQYYQKQWTTVGERFTDRATLPVNRNPNALPRLSFSNRGYNYLLSDAWWSMQDASYCSLRNLVIGYTLPKSWISKAGIENLRVYVTGNNLYEWNNAKDGYIVETARTTGKDANPITGNSYGSYPFSRSFTFGIDVTF